MKLTKRERSALAKDLRQGARRSPLFWWLVEHADEFLNCGNEPISWVMQCERFAKLGLTNKVGQPIGEFTAQKTWQRVKAYLAKHEANRPQMKVRPQRSSRSNEWQPPIATQIPDPRYTNVTIHGAERVGGHRSTESVLPPLPPPEKKPGRPLVTYDDLSPEKKAMIDKVRAEFREADRRRAGNL